MKKIDYIIVGNGYAAYFFAHQLLLNGKSFVLFSDDAKSASRVSAGIINPVVLKKFTTFWLAQQQIDFLKKTLSEIEKYTLKNYLIEEPVHRIFHNENEKNLWLKKSDEPQLSPFLNKKFQSFSDVHNPFQTGEVMQSGRLDVRNFFIDFENHLKENGFLIKEKFDYGKLQPLENTYENFNFQSIVFCEGMGVKQNPFFSEIPVNPNKGHHLKVQLSEKLKENVTFKKKHFLFSYDENLHYYGGTYDRKQADNRIDESAVHQLEQGLSEIYPHSFKTVSVEFGFRPTVQDRRPILGKHQQFDNLYVFNGLGARGILNGCYFSKQLFDYIESGKPLPEEVSLERFGKGQK